MGNLADNHNERTTSRHPAWKNFASKRESRVAKDRDRLPSEGEEMKNFKWFLLAAGVVAIGSMAISLAPDIARYARIRAM
jgi:hypothetical protein